MRITNEGARVMVAWRIRKEIEEWAKKQGTNK